MPISFARAAAGGLAVTGFVLSEPLCAAWLDEGTGQEEWDRHNELVHRAAQLPPWFALGFGWHVEESVRHGIYCFPYRVGFVWASEHGGWEKDLATAFKPSRRKRDGLPAELTIDEFAGWDPMHDGEGFDVARAHIAFGVVRYLAREHADAFGPVARAFDHAIRTGWKVVISDTEWRTDPSYKLPAAEQLAILQSVDPDFLRNATHAFAKPKR